MARPSFIPTIGKKPVAPTAPVKPESVVEEQVFDEMNEMEETEMNETEEKKSRRKSSANRKTPNRQMTIDDVKFIVENIKNMSYTEIAEARGLTKFQVNRVLMKTKKDLRDYAKQNPDKAKAIEAHIAANLSRPEDAQIGGRGSQVSDSINSVVDDIIASIG